PPIWIGARQPRMLRLVARYADAWNTVWHPWPQGVAEVHPSLLRACAEVGRNPTTIELTAGSMVRLLEHGTQRNPDVTGIAGSPEETATGLPGFADVGVRHLVLIIQPQNIASIERFGRVIELLRGLTAR